MLSLEYLHHFCLRKHCPLITTKKPLSSLFLWHSACIMPCHNLCPSFSFFPHSQGFLGTKICEFSVSSVSHTTVVLGAVIALNRRSDTTHESAQNLPFSKVCPAHQILLECSVGQIVHLPHSKGSCNSVQRN